MTQFCWPSAMDIHGLFRTSIEPCTEYWRVIRFAMLMATFYVMWLRVFEYWLEPMARRGVGRILGGVIVWVPAVRPFRIWGLRDGADSARDAAVGAIGHVTVALSAVVPAALWHVVSTGRSDERGLPASFYLASLIMMSLFVIRSLVGKVEGC
jgi:hypothetical protein